MADADFHAKYRAQREHQAAVPVAIAAVRAAVTDFDGSPMSDGEAPRDGLTCASLRTLLAEVDRLSDLAKQQRKDAAEAEREFQREARDIAAEVRWQERNDRDDVPYGTY